MQSVILSTDGVPEAERFAYWREAVLERYIGVTGERHKEQPAPFAAQLVGAVGGAVARIRARAEGHHVIRQPRDIARRGGEAQITVFRASKKVAWRRPNGQEWVTQPGDLAVGDTTFPFSCWVEGDYDSETWVLPRKLLDPHLPIALRGPPYPILSGASGVAGIIKAYLDAFAAQIDALDDREADLVADNFCRLLAVACGAQAEDQREPIRLARSRKQSATSTSIWPTPLCARKRRRGRSRCRSGVCTCYSSRAGRASRNTCCADGSRNAEPRWRTLSPTARSRTSRSPGASGAWRRFTGPSGRPSARPPAKCAAGPGGDNRRALRAGPRVICGGVARRTGPPGLRSTRVDFARDERTAPPRRAYDPMRQIRAQGSRAGKPDSRGNAVLCSSGHSMDLAGGGGAGLSQRRRANRTVGPRELFVRVF